MALYLPSLLLSPAFHSVFVPSHRANTHRRHFDTVLVDDEPAAAQVFDVASPVCKCSSEELEALKAIGGDFANVYGEITERGFRVLAERMRLGKDDVLVDCGSGQGSVVLQAAREYSVRQSVGVEFAASRHSRAAARLACSESDLASRVSLINGDCADEARWAAEGELSRCTCAYMCNVLFDEALNARLKQCVEGCPSIRCVAAYQPWPEGLDGFAAPYEVTCETTWAPLQSTFVQDTSLDRWVAKGGSTLYVYERRGVSFLQLATSREVNFVVVALTVARAIWLYLGEQ